MRDRGGQTVDLRMKHWTDGAERRRPFFVCGGGEGALT